MMQYKSEHHILDKSLSRRGNLWDTIKIPTKNKRSIIPDFCNCMSPIKERPDLFRDTHAYLNELNKLKAKSTNAAAQEV